MQNHLKRFLILILLGFAFAHCEAGPTKPDLQVEMTVEEEVPTEKLLADLDSKDVFLRSQAAIQLGSRQEKKSIPKLKTLLKDTEPGVRAGAAIALGDLQDKSSTQNIVSLLETDKENPKDVYLDALTRMKDVKAGKNIFPLLNSEDATLRLQTVEALVQIGAKDQGANILALALKNKDREKDKTYAMALGKLGYAPSENYLIRITEVQDDSPSLAAAYLALGRVKSKLGIPNLVKALDHSYSKGKENASMALIEIGDPKIISMTFPLIESKTNETRLYVTDVLASIPSKEAGEKALKLLSSDKQYTWGSAAKILGRQKFAPAREKLEELLLNQKAPERDSYAEALGWLGDKRSIPVLRKILLSGEKEGPYGSAWALGVMQAKEAIPDLLKAVESSDPKLVSYSLEALGSIGEADSLPTLIRLLENRPKMAPQILSAIGQIDSEEARIAIEKATLSSDADVYRPAMEEIARRKDKNSIPILFDHVNGEHPEKRKLSYYALAAVTGEHFRTKQEWNAWRSKSKP
ncbi:HEAT repeat domain-containing protein [Leptospira idonii]|uniref:HEAT repeat domain-containing protein n=1 Tax=Leptospira idonii TaxID=1193500 RepID=A0A4R9LUG1_9LEPT|nr:HEAT repeat domain-containing protein [Leptospira idonii]TGN17575.1 HEAT repeat domain-containing protein [Leptospira idonii]